VNITMPVKLAIRYTLVAIIASTVCGCAIPMSWKREYVETWHHYYPPATNEVAK